MTAVKVLLVGDACTNKTSFGVCWATGQVLEKGQEIPTVFDGYESPVKVGDREVLIRMWDTAGQEEYKKLRPLSYPQTDVFLVFFSYESMESLENIRSQWVPEIKEHVKRPPVLMLVGMRFNVREDYQLREAMGECPFCESPVKDEMVEEVVAQTGADGFMECCPLINHSVPMVLERALEIFLEPKEKKKKETKTKDEPKKKTKRRWFWQKKSKGDK